MSKVIFLGKSYQRLDNVSVLDTLLDQGLHIPHGCKSGVCQSCLMRATEGEVPAEAQGPLKTSQKERNFFLACSCFPDGDLTVVLPADDEVLTYQVQVLEKTRLNETVLGLKLTLPQDFKYRAGQFINLIKDADTQRSYSLASVPGVDDILELQVKLIENGTVSRWLDQSIHAGDSIKISEAHGDCFYQEESKTQSLLLIGTGTGLAPLAGVVRDALFKNHEGEIYLYHGVSSSKELYLQENLTTLSDTYKNFHYFPCVSRDEAGAKEINGRANDIALQQHSNLKGFKVYLCGNPNMTEATRKKAFLAGASFQDILVDAFKFASS